MSYQVAAPDEYLAITGMSVKTVKITKASWVWPFQRAVKFSVQPHDYAMNLQAMTKEKLQFLLPVIFTVGPDVNKRGANAVQIQRQENHDNELTHEGREDRGDALMKYAMLLTDTQAKKGNNTNQFLENIVKGIIEGEVRVLVSSMTMEEIFTEREEFKRRIFRNIQSELDQFGLKIYNANVKELRDAPGSTYFESLSRKAHEGATNQARVDVAAAQLMGNVGEAKRKGEQEREVAKINADTAVQKTERDIERSKAEATLATERSRLNKDVDIARIEAERATEAKDEDLKKLVQVKRAAAEMERLRASDVVKATITRESKQQAADAKAYEIEADARANLEKAMKNTDGNAYKIKTEADVGKYAALQHAEAELAIKVKEAEGITAMAEAYSKMASAFGGPAGLLQYMMIEKGTYVELANANAKAVAGMQPKISVWNTGSQAGSEGDKGNSSINTMRNVYQMLPPLMSTINEQTGITLPEWQFGRLAGASVEGQMGQVQKNKDINGDY